MIYLFGLLFIIGLILAGSDGPAFPWPNIAGLACMAGAAAGINKIYPKTRR
jgi:hypothetical protein